MTLEEMRARFHGLGQQREAIHAQSMPLRERRDAISQAADRQVRALNEEIKALEAPLFDLDQERAALARALKGQTGEPPQATPTEG